MDPELKNPDSFCNKPPGAPTLQESVSSYARNAQVTEIEPDLAPSKQIYGQCKLARILHFLPFDCSSAKLEALGDRDTVLDLCRGCAALKGLPE